MGCRPCLTCSCFMMREEIWFKVNHLDAMSELHMNLASTSQGRPHLGLFFFQLWKLNLLIFFFKIGNEMLCCLLNRNTIMVHTLPLASQGRPRPGSVLSCPECVTLRNGRGNIFWRGDLGTLFSMLQPSQSKWKQTKPEGVLWLSSG